MKLLFKLESRIVLDGSAVIKVSENVLKEPCSGLEFGLKNTVQDTPFLDTILFATSPNLIPADERHFVNSASTIGDFKWHKLPIALSNLKGNSRAFIVFNCLTDGGEKII